MPKQVIVHKHYFVPQPYYQPVKYALAVFRSGKSFSDSVTITLMMFNKAPGEKLNEQLLRKHLIKWIASD